MPSKKSEESIEPVTTQSWIVILPDGTQKSIQADTMKHLERTSGKTYLQFELVGKVVAVFEGFLGAYI